MGPCLGLPGKRKRTTARDFTSAIYSRSDRLGKGMEPTEENGQQLDGRNKTNESSYSELVGNTGGSSVGIHRRRSLVFANNVWQAVEESKWFRRRRTAG